MQCAMCAVVAPEYAVTAKTKLTMQNPCEDGSHHGAAADAGHTVQEYHVSDSAGEPPHPLWVPHQLCVCVCAVAAAASSVLH